MGIDELFEPEPDPVAWLVNIKTGVKYDIYIGRGSIWGNPYSHLAVSAAEFQVQTREEAIQCYRSYILGRPDLLSQLDTLYGKILGCWCVPKLCHGQVLIELLWKKLNSRKHL